MKKSVLLVFVVAGVLAFGLLLASCGPQETSTPCPTQAPCPDCPEAPECPDCPECPEPEEGIAVPFEELWAESGHADATAEAFRHWDEDDPPEVSTSCAKCHSSYGFQDFLGADGTAAGVVDNAAAIDSTIDCVACHNEVTLTKDSVVMPSGVEITGLGGEARCMECHQGRDSGVGVSETLAEAGVADDDEVSENIGFYNIHYFPAAATQLGGEAVGGFQYEGKTYDAKFAHVEGYDACVDCHNSHTLEVKVDECQACHVGVTAETLGDIRMMGSLADYDGDGDVGEGIAAEIAGLQELLYAAMQAYATEVAGSGLVYDATSYPYFFDDAGERYASWTARLSKAAYNYQFSVKDPGAFAHNGKYIIQLLYDSIEDLNTAISSPIDLSAAHRIDAGHFAGSEEAFRHWDEDGEVSSRCSRCHSATGLPFYIENGTNLGEPTANGFLCTTCHDAVPGYTRYEVTEVEFPSGATVDSGNPDMNLCMSCHQGRESGASVDAAIANAGVDDDTVSEDLSFRNVHYFAAGATVFGSEVGGGYEYEGQTYNGRFAHVGGFDNCAGCHDVHGLTLKEELCSTCHAGIESAHDIRISTDDFDGDGDASEGIAGEIETLAEALYAAIQAYATDVVGTGIVYDAHSHPYFFDEAGERYASWTPRLLRAAYNYQYVQKDPGAFAHNGKYVVQLLIDSMADLGADTSGMVRP